MDRLTKEGLNALEHERYFAEWYEDRFNCTWVETAPDSPARVDAMIIEKNVLTEIVEVKVRFDMSRETLKSHRQNRWLITWDKIESILTLSKLLHVPGIAALYMPNTKEALLQQISTHDGILVPDVYLSNTETQATINGGRAVRTNAFVDMTNAIAFPL